MVHWVEDHLMRSGRFRLPGKKQLLKGFGRREIVVMDVTETPIERPKRHQRRFYSGKKKQHTLKCQVLIDLPGLRRQRLELVSARGQQDRLAMRQ